MCYGTEVVQRIQKAHVVWGTYDCPCGLLTITRSWDHYTSHNPPPPNLFLLTQQLLMSSCCSSAWAERTLYSGRENVL